jgi:hypothetical protein
VIVRLDSSRLQLAGRHPERSRFSGGARDLARIVPTAKTKHALTRKLSIFILCLAGFALSSCSPRDFLTRRLAADLISASEPFKTPQKLLLVTGVVSNKDYIAPERPILQHRGWITVASAPCSAGLAPSPCWNIVLTPSGVDAVRSILSSPPDTASFPIPAAKRELMEITGISKQSNTADVEFTWKWIPLNEIGEAIYPSGVNYKSTVAFRKYDDGWRVVQDSPQSGQTLEGAFKNAEPSQ